MISLDGFFFLNFFPSCFYMTEVYGKARKFHFSRYISHEYKWYTYAAFPLHDDTINIAILTIILHNKIQEAHDFLDYVMHFQFTLNTTIWTCQRCNSCLRMIIWKVVQRMSKHQTSSGNKHFWFWILKLCASSLSPKV